jgi:hypothetical protein
MIPIGFVTCNRHKFLDVTLRSLSATTLPADQEVIVYDDCSDDASTLTYLYTNNPVALAYEWPDFDIVRDIESQTRGPGIERKVHVVRFDEPLGVMRGSCKAFHDMIERYGTERGIIMCQDDLIFNEDWLARLTVPVTPVARPVGLVAGIWLQHNLPARKVPQLVEHGGITAQCYYLTTAGCDAIAKFLRNPPKDKVGFDNRLCQAVRSAADVYALSPAMGQHIGIASTVRPWVKWRTWGARGRLDWSSQPPYAMAPSVKKFVKPKEKQ